MQPLENALDKLFVRHAPSLPRNGKKTLIEYLPWLSLALGLLALYAVYALWHWAHLVNSLLTYSGGSGTAGNHLSFGVWLGLIVLGAEALLYLAAFPAIRARQKTGWNLMFYALLVNAAYGVVIASTAYGSLGNLLVTLIASAAGLYLLFQIRTSYGQRRAGRNTG
jgi:hypothetical protein